MSTPFLSLDWLNVRIGGRDVVHEVTLTLKTSKLVALVGPNGAGKTTLLRAIAGLVRSSGVISLAGRNQLTMGRAERARLIGYLPQGHQTHWPLPVRDIVALGRFPHGLTNPARISGADADAVDRAMKLAGVDDLADRIATRLSGGERARVALARVLALDAPMILADEPTASLDPRYQLEVMGLLKTMAGNGTLVIAVTHDLSHAAHFADEVIVLNEGRIVTFGSPADALNAGVLADVFKVLALSDAGHERRLLVPWDIAP